MYIRRTRSRTDYWANEESRAERETVKKRKQRAQAKWREEKKKNNKTEKQISDKIGKLLTFPINVGSFIIKREIWVCFCYSFLALVSFVRVPKFIFRYALVFRFGHTQTIAGSLRVAFSLDEYIEVSCRVCEREIDMRRDDKIYRWKSDRMCENFWMFGVHVCQTLYIVSVTICVCISIEMLMLGWSLQLLCDRFWLVLFLLA